MHPTCSIDTSNIDNPSKKLEERHPLFVSFANFASLVCWQTSLTFFYTSRSVPQSCVDLICDHLHITGSVNEASSAIHIYPYTSNGWSEFCILSSCFEHCWPSGMPPIESDKTIKQLAKCAITVEWGLGASDDTNFF